MATPPKSIVVVISDDPRYVDAACFYMDTTDHQPRGAIFSAVEGENLPTIDALLKELSDTGTRPGLVIVNDKESQRSDTGFHTGSALIESMRAEGHICQNAQIIALGIHPFREREFIKAGANAVIGSASHLLDLGVIVGAYENTQDYEGRTLEVAMRPLIQKSGAVAKHVHYADEPSNTLLIVANGENIATSMAYLYEPLGYDSFQGMLGNTQDAKLRPANEVLAEIIRAQIPLAGVLVYDDSRSKAANTQMEKIWLSLRGERDNIETTVRQELDRLGIQPKAEGAAELAAADQRLEDVLQRTTQDLVPARRDNLQAQMEIVAETLQNRLPLSEGVDLVRLLREEGSPYRQLPIIALGVREDRQQEYVAAGASMVQTGFAGPNIAISIAQALDGRIEQPELTFEAALRAALKNTRNVHIRSTQTGTDAGDKPH